jgi:RNA polymerase sigma factor (sigma-70 family)
MEEPLNTWFKREILIHEAALLRYLARVWPKRDDIYDLRQETYARVYQAAGISRPQAARSFLFTTAHHLMIDRVRRERVVPIEVVGDIEALHVLVDDVSTEQRVSAREELNRLAQALDRLPRKCRQVVWMRRVEELSHKEIARKLGIAEKTVEKHIARGSRLLAQYLLGADVVATQTQQPESQDDHRHGKR